VVALFNQFMAAGLPSQNGISATTPSRRSSQTSNNSWLSPTTDKFIGH